MSSTRQRTRRTTLVGSVVISLALTMAACGSSSNGGSAEGLTTVKIGVVPTLNTAMPNLAIDEKLGQPAGLNLERATIAGAGSTNQVAAVLSGSLDVAIGGTNTIVDAIAQGAKLQLIAGVAPLLDSLVITKSAADRLNLPANAPSDAKLRALKGLKIAVSPPGSTGNSVLRAMLSGAGLNPDKDVTLVPLSSNGAIPSGLKNDQFDASFAAVGNGEVAVANGYGVLWVSLPLGDVPAFKQYVGVSAFASRDFIQSHPKIIDGVHESFVAAQRMTTSNPMKVGAQLKESVFPELAQNIFDQSWNQVKNAYPASMNFTQQNWDTFVSLFDASSPNDYKTINYNDLVASAARGS